VNPIDSTTIMSPLNVSSSRTVGQCFSQQELKECSLDNPLHLYIYFSAGSTSAVDAPGRDFLNKTVFFSNTMLQYFSTIVEDVESELGEARKSVQNVQDALFSTLIDIVPDGDAKTPVSMIISKAMHIMPWELMINEPIVRFMSIQDMKSHYRKRSFTVPNNEVVPKYFSLHNSTFDKNNVVEENDRRKYLLSANLKRLHVKRKTPSCNRFYHELVPFHSPLIKLGKKVSAYRRQYKFVQWIDTASITRAADIVPLFKNMDMSPPSVMLLTYADLLEFNETLQYLYRSRLECTYLFIPASKMKVVVTKLMKVSEEYLKPKYKSQYTDPHSFLTGTISAIQNELNIPIAIMGPMSS